ncbi:zinc ribbon domain-containing protein [Clostridium sp. SYSU_GA19001]|uniref:zinc ribbon domain-containing protein n=1 Tax=Clostridium caldaquaticum TaxID=2940653 RepID=UPI0020772AE8|nr:zinc ribbon domain-containing protein [Clostridium caldaquaticum]MCM8709861.1 zinc ribbon domain-containing protein [Clostridium caldaquaticum]
MFFIGGVSSKQKKLDFNQTIICVNCGRYGRYEIFMEYMYLSLFFIPTLKWNKKYYAVSSCCSSVYSISNELGDRIARGEQVTLSEQDLHFIHNGRTYFAKQCPNCGFETQEDFQYCPRCASPLK